MKGIIVGNISNSYKIESSGKTYTATARGKFKNQDITPLVGDEVEIEVTDEVKEIAVIEDSHFSRLHLKDIFDRYKIKSVRYFESGTELAESKKIYDIYLVDLVLQDEFGKNIIAELREKSDESLIFAVTSLNNPNLLADVIDSGADDIIIKPIEEKIFIAKLKSFVRKLQ